MVFFMFRNTKIIFVLLFSVTTIYSQTKEISYQKGNEVINNATKAIYKEIQLKNIASISLRREISSVTESTFVIQIQGKLNTKIRTSKSIEEQKISLVLPDKINIQYSSENSQKNNALITNESTVKTRMVLNGKDANQKTEIFRGGKLINPENYNKPKVLPEIIKNEPKKIDTEKAVNVFDKEDIVNEIWDKVFPVFLNDLFDKTTYKYKYIGKAESPDIRASIIELEMPEKKITLYFDDKTNLLLQLELNLQTNEFTEVKKYFFSNYQIQDGILVAKKINVETVTSMNMKDVKDEGDFVVKDFKTKTTEEIIIKELKVNITFRPSEFVTN